MSKDECEGNQSPALGDDFLDSADKMASLIYGSKGTLKDKNTIPAKLKELNLRLNGQIPASQE